jgi:hypothetical protein
LARDELFVAVMVKVPVTVGVQLAVCGVEVPDQVRVTADRPVEADPPGVRVNVPV